MRLYTAGHSKRALEELLELISEPAVRLLVDVRRHPGSRRHPHFGQQRLAAALAREGIEYRHEPALGGRRRPLESSRNTAWRHPGFRAFADHMKSAEFRAALERLVQPSERPTVLLCAEALPWRCHRQLIADALVARGAEVVHLLEPGRSEQHRLHAAARISEDGTVVYPGTPLLEG